MNDPILSSLIFLAIVTIIIAACASDSPRPPPKLPIQRARRALREIQATGKRCRRDLHRMTEEYLRDVERIVERREE